MVLDQWLWHDEKLWDFQRWDNVCNQWQTWSTAICLPGWKNHRWCKDFQSICKHLERPGSRVGLLFADFSSAFNKMQPHILTERHASYFRLLHHILLLLLDFWTDRVLCVFVNGHLYQAITSKTGSPQGCVLSPLLFIMYSCRSCQQGSSLVKLSDDLLQGPQSDHGCALSSFIKWCDDNLKSKINPRR